MVVSGDLGVGASVVVVSSLKLRPNGAIQICLLLLLLIVVGLSLQQWVTMTRFWWLYDAKFQSPFKSAKLIALYLQGKHKPIYHPLSKYEY